MMSMYHELPKERNASSAKRDYSRACTIPQRGNLQHTVALGERLEFYHQATEHTIVYASRCMQSTSQNSGRTCSKLKTPLPTLPANVNRYVRQLKGLQKLAWAINKLDTNVRKHNQRWKTCLWNGDCALAAPT